MSDVKVSYTVYTKMKKHLISECIQNPDNKEIEDLYKNLTGDNDLSDLKSAIVLREVQTFIEEIKAQTKENAAKGSYKLTIDDYGYDYDRFYINFYSDDFNFLKIHHDSIVEFLQNVSDRTSVVVSPQFNHYVELKPSGAKTEEVIEPPKISYNKKMEVELNEV